MIHVTDKYAIRVDKFQYTSGLIVKNKKGEEHLTDCRYFSKLTNAFKDIAERKVKDTLSDSDMSLKEAVETIDSIYSEFDKKMDEVWVSITHVDKRMY